MKAKELFEAVRNGKKGLQNLHDRMEFYREMATSTTGLSEIYIRSSENHSKTERAALALIELSDKLGAELENYAELVRRADRVLEALDDPSYKEILTLRYLKGLSWFAIQQRTGAAEVDVLYKRNGRALLAADKILESI